MRHLRHLAMIQVVYASPRCDQINPAEVSLILIIKLKSLVLLVQSNPSII